MPQSIERGSGSNSAPAPFTRSSFCRPLRGDERMRPASLPAMSASVGARRGGSTSTIASVLDLPREFSEASRAELEALRGKP